MIIEPHKEQNYVIIWTTHADKYDIHVQNKIEQMIADNKANKIKTVVFMSGNGSLPELTSALLLHNQEKMTRSQEIDRESMDLLMNLCYNMLTKRK